MESTGQDSASRRAKDDLVLWGVVCILFVSGFLFGRHGVWALDTAGPHQQQLLQAATEAAIFSGFVLFVCKIARSSEPRKGLDWTMFAMFHAFLLFIVVSSFNTGKPIVDGLALLYESAGCAMVLTMIGDALGSSKQSGKSVAVSFAGLWLACLVSALLPKFWGQHSAAWYAS